MENLKFQILKKFWKWKRVLFHLVIQVVTGCLLCVRHCEGYYGVCGEYDRKIHGFMTLSFSGRTQRGLVVVKCDERSKQENVMKSGDGSGHPL